MARVPGSLSWRAENRFGWISTIVGTEVHRIYIHASLGFIFESHACTGTIALGVEALMKKTGLCPCHLLALWERKRLVWHRGIVRPLVTTTALRVMHVSFLDPLGKTQGCILMATSPDMLLFAQVLHQLEKDIRILWSNRF